MEVVHHEDFRMKSRTKVLVHELPNERLVDVEPTSMAKVLQEMLQLIVTVGGKQSFQSIWEIDF